MKKASLLLIVLVFLLPACYWRNEVQATERGVIMKDGVSVSEIVGPGRYSDNGFYAEVKTIDISPKTSEWTDPSLVTRDKQPIGLKVGLTVQRDPGAVQFMWENYRSEATNDEAMWQLVFNRVPRAAKAITTKYSLNQMLGIPALDESGVEIPPVGREVVAGDLAALLAEELNQVGISLLDLGINDIEISPEFKASLERKAAALVEVEIAKANEEKLTAQLEETKKANLIKVENAKTEAEINTITAETVGGPENYFQLLLLREQLQAMDKLTQIIGPNDKVIYIPGGSNLVSVISGFDNSHVTPVTVPPPADETEGAAGE